jgi:hypothetical protein
MVEYVLRACICLILIILFGVVSSEAELPLK